MPNHYENQDDIEDLEANLKTAKKQKKKTNALAAAVEFIQNTQLYYISKLDRYLVKDAEKRWHFLKPTALSHTYPEFGDGGFREAFTLAMEDAKRIFLDCTYSFTEYPNTLNKMDISDWLQPSTGQHHWIFDDLMRSLGGDKPENIDHLKHVIAYKYLNPSCWLLPCIVIYGEGRVGKNLLVDSVLYTIFARQTISDTSDNLVSTFNSLLEGRMVVLVNETVVGKHDRAKLYNQLAKARTTINMKGVPQYDVDNAALFFIGSNDWNGATLLDRSKADERLSIMCCPKQKGLTYWIAQSMGGTEDEAQQWLWKEGGKILEDKQEVAKWLGYLIAQFGDKPQPKALHGADYMEVMGVQTRIDESLMEAVFRDDAFEYISVSELHEAYLAISEARNIRFTIGMKLFNRQVEMWLAEHHPHVVKHTQTITGYIGETGSRKRVLSQKTAWVNTQTAYNVEQSNRDKYLGIDGYKIRWQGPEVI